ncbi:MAG: uroporphyrinogen decarboxylase [Spirochaetota bacterium]|nr:MAG: uroporphyrinogen decarboxylase [Spirochaetota bacterium]
MEEKKAELSAEQKQDELFQRWLEPKDPEGNNLTFKNSGAEKLYRERITRIKDAIQLKKLPDRVPVCPLPSMFPAFYSGISLQEAMYDYDKCCAAWKKYVLDFEPDAHMGCAAPGSGKFFEILDYKLYAWPGHGVSPEHSYQCIEGEYMMADEYDELIHDPSHFFNNIYLPRVFGSLDPFKMLPFLPGILEMYGVAFNFIPYGLPPVQTALKALMEAGSEALKWAGAVGGFDGEMAALGFPQIIGGFTKAPFDTLGDTLRGTKGIMLDMYRQPDKLLQALEVITPLMIKMGVGAAKMNGKPIIFMPLHKGADGFLSDDQFKKFYWPTFRKVIVGLIEEGCVPFPAAEGGYNSRLSVIKDVPKGKTVWMFDKTDMANAKEILGNTACILGNMPLSILNLGTPDDVREYARKLIDDAAEGGGYIMANGAFFDNVKAENLKAMVDFTKEYGVYK